MAIVFDEWANRYAANPEAFDEILDGNGKPIESYGERCAVQFYEITRELGDAGKLPEMPQLTPDKVTECFAVMKAEMQGAGIWKPCFDKMIAEARG